MNGRGTCSPKLSVRKKRRADSMTDRVRGTIATAVEDEEPGTKLEVLQTKK